MDPEARKELPEVFDPVEVQALHRRLLAAKARGEEPDPDDLALRDRVGVAVCDVRQAVGS